MFGLTHRITSAVAAAFTTGDKLTVMGPCTLKGFGAMVIGTAGTTTAVVIKADKIVQGGSRGDGDGGILTSPSVTQSLGQVIYKQVNVKLALGDAVVLEVATAMGGTGAGIVFADVEPEGFQPAGQTLAKASST